MDSLLELTPHGHVVCRAPHLPLPAFTPSDAPGLVALGGHKPPDEADGSVRFWKAFADEFIRALCHQPDDADGPVAPPSPAELAEQILNAPPMRGAEYLSPALLVEIWNRMADWTRHRVAELGGLTAFLESHAPCWTRVGRVTLHLAENKADPAFPFAFMATYAAGLTQSGRLQQLPLGRALQEYAGANNKPALLKLLSPLHTAATNDPLLADLLETGDIFHPLAWSPAEAYEFLKAIPHYEAAGLSARLPDWWRKKGPRPKVGITIGEKKQGALGLHALLDFHIDVVVGGQSLTREDVAALLAGAEGLVLFRGQWIEVDREKLHQALAHWEAVERHGGISFAEGMRLLAGAPANLRQENELEEHRDWSFTQPGAWLKQTLEQLRQPDQLAPPKPLQAQLRPYQKTGLDWLWFCAQTGLGACLADDMGLGKTIQILAALLRKKDAMPNGKPALLVVPASLIGNWQREAARFAPTLELFIAHRQYAQEASLPNLNVDLVITTYGMLERLGWPLETDWSWVVLDEAQAIKNHATRQSRAVRKLRADARFALTGTPIENRLGDLWALFDFLNPGLLGSAAQFSAFTKAIQSGNHEHYAPLRRLVNPYILRRLKTDRSIISDLPEKTEMRVFCGLSKSQAALYQQSVQSLAQELKETDGIQRKGLVLTYLMRFKQICNHPDQLTGTGDYAPHRSAKFQRLETLCAEIDSRGEKVLIFTQFREITDPLADCLSAVFGRPGLVLHGGTSVKKRQELVEQFQREDGPPFFVLSIKAGGTGLNLTAASHVVHFDRWWNPAIENQATDRAFRIGQKNNVLVHKFVTSGTLEEKIDHLLAEKQETADRILAGGAEKTLTEMDNEELLRLVALNLEQATEA